MLQQYEDNQRDIEKTLDDCVILCNLLQYLHPERKDHVKIKKDSESRYGIDVIDDGDRQAFESRLFHQ